MASSDQKYQLDFICLLVRQLKWFVHCWVQFAGEGTLSEAGQVNAGVWAHAKARHAMIEREEGLRWI